MTSTKGARNVALAAAMILCVSIARTEQPRVPIASQNGASVDNDGYASLAFDTISDYKLTIPLASAQLSRDPNVLRALVESQIPKQLWLWNNRRVKMAGYLWPTKQIDGNWVELLLSPSNNLAEKHLNQWVIARCSRGVPVVRPDFSGGDTVVRGVFKIGVIREHGIVSAIYCLDLKPGQLPEPKPSPIY